MNASFTFRLICVNLLVSALILAGCQIDPLPSTMDVRLPDGSLVSARRDGGAATLARSRWEVCSDATNPTLLFRVEFGDAGEVVRIVDNHINRDVVGEELFLQQTPHLLPMAGAVMFLAAYGATNGDQIGMTFVVRVFIGTAEVVSGSLHFEGVIDGDRADGTWTSKMSVDPNLTGIDAPALSEQSAYAIRLPEVANGDDNEEPNNAPAQATALTIGETRTLSLAPDGDEDWMTFTLDEAAEVTIETSGSAGDTELGLYDGNLRFLWWNDDKGTDSFSRIQTQELAAGTYYVQVRQFRGSPPIDRYELALSTSRGDR